MKIVLEQVGKKYTSGWVIREMSHIFQSGSITGVSGKNGSGKSTLLQIISSILTPSEGTVKYFSSGEQLALEDVPQKITHSAPSIDLIESLTVLQTLRYHFSFRKLLPTQSIDKLINTIWLDEQRNSNINELSSGMKQRLKLALVFFTETELILLDEPTSNLDKEGIDLLSQLIENYQLDRTIVIASNEERDFTYCQEIINTHKWK